MPQTRSERTIMLDWLLSQSHVRNWLQAEANSWLTALQPETDQMPLTLVNALERLTNIDFLSSCEYSTLSNCPECMEPMLVRTRQTIKNLDISGEQIRATCDEHMSDCPHCGYVDGEQD